MNDFVYKVYDEDILNIFFIVVRDSGWSVMYIEEMEVDYLWGGERWVMRDLKNFVLKKFVDVSSKVLLIVVMKSVVDNIVWMFFVLKLRVF